jgi:hypothetical protein
LRKQINKTSLTREKKRLTFLRAQFTVHVHSFLCTELGFCRLGLTKAVLFFSFYYLNFHLKNPPEPDADRELMIGIQVAFLSLT